MLYLSIHLSVCLSLVFAVCGIPALPFNFITRWLGGRSHLTNAGHRLLLLGNDVTFPLLRKFLWGRCESPLRVWKSAHGMDDYGMPMWLLQPVQLQSKPYQCPEVCTKPTLHLAFTVPGKTLNASLYSSLRYDVVCWGMGIFWTLLGCSWTASRVACCFSSRVERHDIISHQIET